MITVVVRPDEPIDRALKRLEKQRGNAGLFQELKRRTHHMKPSERRRWKSARTRARAWKNARRVAAAIERYRPDKD